MYSIRRKHGKDYRVTMDETFKQESPEERRANRQWFEQIPCRENGAISLYAEEKKSATLRFYTPKRRKVCRKLAAAHTGMKLDDQFDGYETLLFFPASLLPIVAEAVGAFKKRKLSPRAKLAAIACLQKAKKMPID